MTAQWDSRAALGVVLAAGGYPDSRAHEATSFKASRMRRNSPGKVFHAGTKLDEDGNVVTNGGRVLCAVGLGTNVREAQREAYALADTIHWNGMRYRRDIGWRAL